MKEATVCANCFTFTTIFFLGKWKKPMLYALALARCSLDHRDPDIINYEILTCNYFFFGKLINIFLE